MYCFDHILVTLFLVLHFPRPQHAFSTSPSYRINESAMLHATTPVAVFAFRPTAAIPSFHGTPTASRTSKSKPPALFSSLSLSFILESPSLSFFVSTPFFLAQCQGRRTCFQLTPLPSIRPRFPIPTQPRVPTQRFPKGQ